MARTIDFDTSLKARGLFALAQQHFAEAEKYERALGECIGVLDDASSDSSYCGHFSDQMCNGGTFDVACRKAEIKIAPRTGQPAKP